MTKIFDLPTDLVEEVLSRVPLTSLRAVRNTCKTWNTLSKNQSFTKKQIGQAAKKKQAKEFQAIIGLDYRVYLTSINLDRIQKDDHIDSSLMQKTGKLFSLPDGHRFFQPGIFHCSGLLLFITSGNTRLVVWNPYYGQTRWIEPRISYNPYDIYALGYVMKNKGHRTHKILRYLDHYEYNRDEQRARIREFEIYNFDSKLWKAVTPRKDLESVSIPYYERGVSIKGNTYMLAREIEEDEIPQDEEDVEEEIPQGDEDVEEDVEEEIPQGEEDVEEVIPQGDEEDVEELDGEEDIRFLLSFDFTKERFGPRLPLPFQPRTIDTIILSSVREEQLAVLYYRRDIKWTGIWISNKIEPNFVSWSQLFLTTVNLRPLRAIRASFFVDEDKKVAVVFYNGKRVANPIHDTAYIFGENGYNKQVVLGESIYKYYFSFGCCYVPSSVQI